MFAARQAGVIIGCGLVAAALAACDDGHPPDLRGLTDQTAIVGQELQVELDGTDPDGGRLEYTFRPDVPLEGSATITQTPGGMGIFHWTPLAADAGAHVVDFTVSDGSHRTTVSITITVEMTAAGAPVFREPLGTGTVVNLSQTPCMTVNIVIEDQDSSAVTIAQEPPLIDGAMLNQTDGLDAMWTWCPTAAQVAAADRYTLVLSADDTTNPKTVKPYVIVLTSNGPHIVINEVDYDNVGTDSSEYVELYNPATSALSLAGQQLVLVNGATSTVYSTIDLASVGTLAGHGYLVIGGPGVTVPAGATKLDPGWTQDDVQNGAPDGLALIDNVTFTVVDALSYEGSITAATIPGFSAPVSLVEGTPFATADSSTATRSLCRFPDGQDTDQAATDWSACSMLTPGAANAQ